MPSNCLHLDRFGSVRFRGLRRAAELKGAGLVPLHDPDLRIDVSVLTARADWLENHDPAYRAELARWSRVGKGRR